MDITFFEDYSYLFENFLQDECVYKQEILGKFIFQSLILLIVQFMNFL